MYQTVENGQDARQYAEMRVEQTIRGFLSEFERAGIPAVILRNVTYIPSEILDRGDIDIAIPKGISEETFLSLVADYGLIHWVWKSKNIHTYFKITDNYILRVDFQRGAGSWIGAEFYSDENIFANTHMENGFLVADEKTQTLLKWLPSFLAGGKYKDRYSSDIIIATRKDPDGMREIFLYALGKKMGCKYFAWAINGTPEESAKHVSETRRAVRWTALWRDPRKTTMALINHFGLEILFRLKLTPSGISMALIGPDGSGKTTLCSRLIDAPYQNLPFLGKAHRRFTFQGLTPLMRKGRDTVSGKKGQKIQGPHDKLAHTIPVGVSRLSFTVLRAWIDEFVWSRHRISHNNIVIYDRHLLDIGVDPLRFRFEGPAWISRLYAGLAPQPDLIVLLDAPAEVVHPRKKEVPMEETKRQRQKYLELVSSKDNVYVIDASKTSDELVSDVNQIINNFMAARTRSRMPKGSVRNPNVTEFVRP